MTRPTEFELAAALGFVLAKWTELGAPAVETKPFEELLDRMKAEPPAPPPEALSAPVEQVYGVKHLPRTAANPTDSYKPSGEEYDEADWMNGKGDQ